MIKKVFNKYFKNQRGLTLVELLAVIVILGIISAIAVPSIGGIINKTKEDGVVADATQVLNAAKLYMASNSFTETDFTNGIDLEIDTGSTTPTNDLEPLVESSKVQTATVAVAKGSNGNYSYTLTIQTDDGYIGTDSTPCPGDSLLNGETDDGDACAPTLGVRP